MLLAAILSGCSTSRVSPSVELVEPSPSHEPGNVPQPAEGEPFIGPPECGQVEGCYSYEIKGYVVGGLVIPLSVSPKTFPIKTKTRE